MPYDPGISYHGDQYVAQSNQAAWQAIGGLLEHFSQQKEAEKEQDKQRARKFKSLVEYADTAGIVPKDRAITMDVDSLEGAVQGHAAKQVFDKSAAELQKFAQEQQDRTALGHFGQDYATGDPAALGRMVAPLTTAPVGQGFSGMDASNLAAFGASTTPANRLDFALANNPGAFASPQFDNSLTALTKFAASGGPGLVPTYQEDPKTGYRNLILGKVVQPTGINPDRMVTPTTATVTDASGNPQVVMINPKTGAGAVVGKPGGINAGDQAKELYDLKKSYIAARSKAYLSDERDYWKQQIDEVDAQIKTINPGKAAAPAPAAVASPVLPTDRKQWKVGQRYLTNKGELMWDGTHFVQ